MKIALHAGFHKTATTFMQSVLEGNAKNLLRDGTEVVSHQHLRSKYTRAAQNYAYGQIGINKTTSISQAEFETAATNFFAGMEHDGSTRRLLLSEENVMGHPGQCALPGLLYRFPKRFATCFAEGLPYPVTEIFVSIRNYADFFSACYVEFLRSASEDRFIPPEIMRYKVMGNMPSWISLIELVQECFPNARITVWRYEDFRPLSSMIFARMALAKVHNKKRAKSDSILRVTASQQAVDQMLKVFIEEGPGAAIEAFRQLQFLEQSDVASARFDPWSQKERAHLTRIYNKDWQALCNASWVETLVPE